MSITTGPVDVVAVVTLVSPSTRPLDVTVVEPTPLLFTYIALAIFALGSLAPTVLTFNVRLFPDAPLMATTP
jgi:hypothetical protein